MDKQNKKGFHITITSLDDGKILVNENSNSIIASVNLGERTMGTAFTSCDAACIVDTIFGAEKVIRNLKKNAASAFTKELLSALCGEDEKHE